MTLRSEIRAALIAHPEGLNMRDLFDVCPSAEDQKKFAGNISVLKAEGKMKMGTIDDNNKPVYIIATWPEKTPAKSKVTKADAAKKPRRRKARQEREPQPPAPRQPQQPDPGEAQFAINALGELGIEKGEKKIHLARAEFAVLREFIERTQEVWEK